MSKTIKEKKEQPSPLSKIYPLVNKLSTGEQITLIHFIGNILDEKASIATQELELIKPISDKIVYQ
jgi:hypothetical protein